jgi:hypothetical protein
MNYSSPTKLDSERNSSCVDSDDSSSLFDAFEDKEVHNKQTKTSSRAENSLYFWNDKEQRRYVNFLVERKSIMELPPNSRKSKKVHQKMSTMVRSRSSLQCRSHHQKMIKKYGSVSAIIGEFKDLIRPSALKKLDKKRETKEIK